MIQKMTACSGCSLEISFATRRNHHWCWHVKEADFWAAFSNVRPLCQLHILVTVTSTGHLNLCLTVRPSSKITFSPIGYFVNILTGSLGLDVHSQSTCIAEWGLLLSFSLCHCHIIDEYHLPLPASGMERDFLCICRISSISYSSLRVISQLCWQILWGSTLWRIMWKRLDACLVTFIPCIFYSGLNIPEVQTVMVYQIEHSHSDEWVSCLDLTVPTIPKDSTRINKENHSSCFVLQAMN